MARDGSGTFDYVEAAFVSGTTIESAKVNSKFSELATAMTASVAKDGQTTPTANLPMGAFKHTGVADGSSRTDYASLGQVAKGSFLYAIDTGSATAYAIAPSPGIAAYVVGYSARFKAVNANSGTTPTLAVNGLAAGTITWPDGTALAAGDIPANAFVECICTSTTPTWHLQTLSVQHNEVQAADIASATTTDIGAAVGTYAKVTGTTTITGLGTVRAGTRREVTFTGALILTHNATSLILPGAANITTIAGDVATFVSEGSGNWRCLKYVRSIYTPGGGQYVSSLTGAVATGTTVLPYDDTIPQNTEGDQYMSLAITPKSALSTLIIDVVWNGAHAAGGGTYLGVALFQDSTADALKAAAALQAGDNYLMPYAFRHVMTSGTTSATTFKVRAGMAAAGTVTFNGTAGARKYGGVMASSITIEERMP